MKNTNCITWTVSSKEWSRFPSWKKDQLKQDRKIGLNRYYKIISLVPNSMSELVYRFDFTKPFLLPNTPLDWQLPEPYKFDIKYDIKNLIYKVGESSPLFKFVNTEAQLSYKDYWYNNITKFSNIKIQMQITLFKNLIETTSPQTEESTSFVPVESTNKELKLILPTIEERYSHYIFHKKYPDSEENSATYYQDIYFPLMEKMGFADSTTNEVFEDKFNDQYDHTWDYLTITVKYNIIKKHSQ